ncbi:MAG TPA: response regulator [Ktedonobacteraceae bacterium]|nr:response regulator [Ktedonobacteraceae bacterium]
MATRILVVNDTQEILDLFQMILEYEGYEVVLSSFPFNHIKEIEKIQPDLIILDFLFGDKQMGWQMLEVLKMQRSTASIPVIVCTAALQDIREQEGYLVSQGVHVVYKPFDSDQLLTIIKQSLVTHKKSISQVEED